MKSQNRVIERRINSERVDIPEEESLVESKKLSYKQRRKILRTQILHSFTRRHKRAHIVWSTT